MGRVIILKLEIYFISVWKYEPHNLHLSLIKRNVNLLEPARFCNVEKKRKRTNECWKSQRARSPFDLSSAAICIRNVFSTSHTDTPRWDQLLPEERRPVVAFYCAYNAGLSP